MTQPSLTVDESLRPRRGRAPRAVPGAAAAAIALAIVVVLAGSAAGTGLALFSKASPAQDGQSQLGAARTTPRTTDYPPAVSPTPTGTIAVPAPTESCVPEFNNGCPPLPAPTVDGSASRGPGLAFTMHVPIFEYHRIKLPSGETGYNLSLVTPPDLFQAQMTAMSAAGWHTITMGQLGDDLRLGIQPTPKSFVVTFDDGYEDGFTNAYPILQRHAFVATYFVVGGQIGRAGHLTVAELQTLNAAGCEIGNHTLDHVDLVSLTPDNQVREILGNSDLIARDIGVWPQSFAYPAGFTDASVIAAVAATPGLETAVVQQSSKPQTWANRWQLSRIRVGPGTYPQDLLSKATRYVP